jgi:hypothetical protein
MIIKRAWVVRKLRTSRSILGTSAKAWAILGRPGLITAPAIMVIMLPRRILAFKKKPLNLYGEFIGSALFLNFPAAVMRRP